MIRIRKANERGQADHGWLQSAHSFSFAGYHEPRFMGFGPLRVLNDDRVAPGKGFGMHAHQDMDIITDVLQGHLCLVVSEDGRDGSVQVNENVQVYACVLGTREHVQHRLAAGRLCYLHVAAGEAKVDGRELFGGDAIMFEDEPGIVSFAGGPAELLLFDLPR